MKNYFGYFFLAFAFLFFPVAKPFAQDATHISLVQLLLQVETNYPSVIRYDYNIKSLKAKSEGIKAWMPPTFSFGLERFPYEMSNLEMKNDPMNEAGLTFSIEQMIVNPTKLNAKKGYIISLAEIEQSKSDWTRNELKKEAKILYYIRYVSDKKQSVISQSEDLLKLLLAAAEEKFANNQAQLQVIYKGRARLTELDNMQIMLEQMAAESNIGINTLLLRDVNTLFEIDTLIAPRNDSNVLVDTSSISLRSDINVMSKSIASMKLEQQVMRIGNRPDFGIRAMHMQMLGMPNQWSVMGMITLPIAPWSSKMYRSETRSVGFQIQAMEQEKLEMELMAKRMLSEKWVMLKYELQQYENYKEKIIPAFESNLQANLLAYRQNTGEFFVLLDAWEMLLMKKIEMYDKLLTVLKLEAEYDYEKETR